MLERYYITQERVKSSIVRHSEFQSLNEKDGDAAVSELSLVASPSRSKDFFTPGIFPHNSYVYMCVWMCVFVCT